MHFVFLFIYKSIESSSSLVFDNVTADRLRRNGLDSFSKNDIQASVKDSFCGGSIVDRVPTLGRVNPICSFSSSLKCNTLEIIVRISNRLRSPRGAKKKPTSKLEIS